MAVRARIVFSTIPHIVIYMLTETKSFSFIENVVILMTNTWRELTSERCGGVGDGGGSASNENNWLIEI